MLYLFLAIVSNVLISILIRNSKKYAHNDMVMFATNYAFCTIIALAYMFANNNVPLTLNVETKPAITIGLVNGVLYLAGFVLLEMNIRYNGVILSNATTRLGGVLIPIIIAITFFHELTQWLQLIGITLAIISIILININDEEKINKSNKKCWLAILLLTSGFADTMANVFDKVGQTTYKNFYLFCTFLIALLIAIIIAKKKKQKITKMDLLFGLFIGIPNYYSARFLLLSLGSVPAIVVYPIFSVGTIIITSLIGFVFFNEKLNNYKKCALLLILISLIILNINV